jgi:hypothetical protein
VQDQASKRQQFVLFVDLGLEEVLLYINVLDHEIILLFGGEALSGGLDILVEELIDVIHDDLLLGNVRLLPVLDRRLSLILSLSHTAQDRLNQHDLVFGFDPLEPADEVLVTFPRPNLSETLKVEQPLVIVSQDVGDELSQAWVNTLNPLPWIYAKRNVLKLLGKQIVKLSINHTFRRIQLLHRESHYLLACNIAEM